MAAESWLTFSYDWSTVQVINGQGIFQPGDLYSGKGAQGGVGWGRGCLRRRCASGKKRQIRCYPEAKAAKSLFWMFAFCWNGSCKLASTLASKTKVGTYI